MTLADSPIAWQQIHGSPKVDKTEDIEILSVTPFWCLLSLTRSREGRKLLHELHEKPRND